jgi:hypothetical protein
MDSNHRSLARNSQFLLRKANCGDRTGAAKKGCFSCSTDGSVTLPPTTDAGLMFIGRIRTPWTSRMETSRQGRADGPMCRIEVSEPWVPALAGLAQYERVEVLYWLRPDLAASYLIAQMQGMGPDGASPAVEHKGPAMSVIKGGPRFARSRRGSQRRAGI